MSSEKPKIFISHAWEEKEIVKRLEEALRTAGADVWVDHSNVRAGDFLVQRVSAALEWCTDLLLIWSHSAGSSKWVAHEWAAAFNADKKIIPCLIDDEELPILLGNAVHVDFRDFDQGLIQLFSALNLKIDQLSQVTASLIGRSDSVLHMFDLIKKASVSKETVLIHGESGTGKELIAGAIHYNSIRKQNPLIIADCAALSESLAESELFGHEKGAFTQADSRKIGKFERAHKATLFFDEISELPQSLQFKLLRFLQDGSFKRLGGEKFIHVDIRLIVASNIHLTKLVSQGKFLQDLYFCLNRLVIDVPPLRERYGDIPLLINHFIKKYNRRNTKQIKGISESALKLLESYHFPGHVRELENIIAYAILMEDSDVINAETILPRLVKSNSG